MEKRAAENANSATNSRNHPLLLRAIVALIYFVFITIPFGIGALRIGVFALWPFGKTVVRRADAGIASRIGNVIGIPLGLTNFKSSRSA